MNVFAHRGLVDDAPENTIAAFEAAVAAGADGIELDVRLTADAEPVVYHYFYLDGFTTGAGPLHARTLAELADVRVLRNGAEHPIPTLREVLEAIAGRIRLEIELKGPEPHSSDVVADALHDFRSHWSSMELTSYEPSLLRAASARVDIGTHLLVHRNEPWMKQDYVAYVCAQRARMAGASGVHLHPTQLDAVAVDLLRAEGIEIHSYDINDRASFDLVRELGIVGFDTDRARDALRWRNDAASP